MANLDLRTYLTSMSEACGVRGDFLVMLLQEPSDWSFVIKAHALLESVAVQLLVAHLDKPELAKVLAKDIEMSDRIKMLSELKLLSSGQRGVLHAFGNLRNGLVHNVKNTDFTFVEYFKNSDNRDNFVKNFGVLWPEQVHTPTGTTLPREEFLLRVPRYALWAAVLLIVADTVSETERRKFDAAQRAIDQEYLKSTIELFSQIKATEEHDAQ